MSDFSQIQSTIRAMNMSKEQIQSLIATLRVKEIHSDKPNRKTYELPTEEQAFWDKCSEKRSEEKRICPKCGSKSTIEYGTRKGRQRYLCKDCKRTFGDTIGTVFYRSKLSFEKWQRLIELVLMGASIRKISTDLEISSNTALYNRHRICSVLMQLVNNTDYFPSIAEGDEYYLPLSFKDVKDPHFFIEVLGRMPYTHRSKIDRYKYCLKLGYPLDLIKKLDKDEEDCNEELLQYVEEKDLRTPRTFSLAVNSMSKEKIFQVLRTLDEQQKKKRGISNQQVCVLSCTDVSKHNYIQPVCVGRIEPKHIEDNLVPHLTRGAILVTDSHRAYKTVANRHKIPLRQIPSGKHTSNGFSLSHINSYHSKISTFFGHYREVASKYVDLYLALFYWSEKHDKEQTDKQVDMLLDIMSNQAKKTYLHEFKFKSMPIDMKGII